MKPNIVRLNIQLTKKCNQRCRSCNSYSLKASELNMAVCKKAILQATELFEIKNIAFTGGEPTIYPHILDIAQFAREKCDKVSITTNGWYCTSKDQVKKLLIAGINRFSFSYHGVGIHDAFTRCSGAEERLIKALDYVIELQSQYPCYVKVGTLYTGNNLDNVESVLQFTRKLGIDLYIEILDTRIPVFKDSLIANENANHFMAVENDLKRIALWLQNGERILMDKQGLAFIDAWFSGEKIEGSCPLWNTDLYIESNGDVRTGCWSLPPIGNIQEESLEVLVHNTIFANNVEKMKNRECQGCTCGYLMQAKYILNQ